MGLFLLLVGVVLGIPMWLVTRPLYRLLLGWRHYRVLRVFLLITAACWSVFAILVMRPYFNLGTVPEDGFVGIEFMFIGLPVWIVCYLPGIVLLGTILTTRRRLKHGDADPNVRALGVIILTTVLLLPLFAAIGLKATMTWRTHRDERIRDYWEEVGAHVTITQANGAVSSASYDTVKGERLAPLASVIGLHELHCRDTSVVDDDLVHIRNLTELIALWLDGTEITDRGLEHVGRCNGLRRLGLSRTQVTDEGLSSLSELSRLEELWLENTAITGEGLKALQPLSPNLRSLHLRGTRITDGGLQHLSMFKRLSSVDLRDCAVSIDPLRKLQESLPNCVIHFPGYKRSTE